MGKEKNFENMTDDEKRAYLDAEANANPVAPGAGGFDVTGKAQKRRAGSDTPNEAPPYGPDDPTKNVYSKSFAGKTINVSHSEHGPSRVQFDEDGAAVVTEAQYAFIMESSAYGPFVNDA